MDYLIRAQMSCSSKESQIVNELIILYQQRPIMYKYIIDGLQKNNIRKTLGISLNTFSLLKKPNSLYTPIVSTYKVSAIIKTVIDLINEDLQ